jgi:hypothetical protein
MSSAPARVAAVGVAGEMLDDADLAALIAATEQELTAAEAKLAGDNKWLAEGSQTSRL